MIKPRIEDIEKFRGYEVDDFVRWLRVALEGLLIDGLGVRNFAPIDYCILREHTVAADMEIVYDAFPAAQRAMIREAIARLLCRLPVDFRYAAVFRTLLDLAAVVGAHEIFAAVPVRGEGFLTLEQTHSDLPSLYSRALDLVVELADGSDEAQACISRLIGTPAAFDFNHARSALIALCKITPDAFATHMALLREALGRNFKKYRPNNDSIEWLVDDILKAVGLAVIEQKWGALRPVDPFRPDYPNDNWFRQAILTKLEIERDPSAGTIIVLKRDRDIRIVAAGAVPAIAPTPQVLDERSKMAFFGIDEFEDVKTIYSDLPSDQLSDQEKSANYLSAAILLGAAKEDIGS